MNDTTFFSKSKIKRIFETESYSEYLELIRSLTEKGIHILTNRFSLNTITAEQIVNDSILKSISKIDEFDETKGKFPTWFIQIMLNTAIDMMRKGILNTSSIEEMSEKGIDFAIDDKELSLEAEENKPLLYETVEFNLALSNLNQSDQEIINLLLNNYSNKEAATLLEIRNATYRKRKERALNHFRKELLEYPMIKNMFDKSK